MRKKLTPEQLAALAAGASLEEVLASATPGEEAEGNEQLAALTAELATAHAALEAAKAENVELAAQLEAAKAEVETKVADIQAKLEAAEAAATAMSSTIEDRIKNMSVALGTAVPDKAATAQELVAQHAELETKFKASFKVGAPTKKAAEPAAKPLFTEAQLAAAKLIPVL